MAQKKPRIRIKPSKQGSLRAATKTKKGKNIPTSTLRRLKKSKSPAMRKKANFALNARSWGKK
jgi:oligoendopeptidase F